MFSTVLPLRSVAFQAFCLLVAIAIESWVLWRNLGITPRQSLQFATTINLLCTVVGWLVFFAVQPLLPEPFRQVVLGFIFFNQWADPMAVWFILLGFIIFFASFALKLLGLEYLRLLLLTPEEWKARQENEVSSRPRLGKAPPIRDRKPSTQASAVLTANALSYSAITVLLFLRFVLADPLLSIRPVALLPLLHAVL